MPDCTDGCDNDPNKTSPGTCGCGVPDTNTDGDSALDCQEECDSDPNKTSPGVCGCGVPDVDTDSDGHFDCNDACPTQGDQGYGVDANGCPNPAPTPT